MKIIDLFKRKATKDYKVTEKMRVGKFGEDVACKYLEDNNYTLVTRNYKYLHKEIDIIAKRENCIVFVEVKTRKSHDDMGYYRPAFSVDREKQANIIEAANFYMKTEKLFQKEELFPRFDVVEVYVSDDECNATKINHIENAFDKNTAYKNRYGR